MEQDQTMTKTGSIVAVLAGLLTAACVPTPDASNSLVANPGLPDGAVISILQSPWDVETNIGIVFLKFYPEKATPEQVAAAPGKLCRSIRKNLSTHELMPTEPNHGGPAVLMMMVRCG